jgi:hypothetical protein
MNLNNNNSSSQYLAAFQYSQKALKAPQPTKDGSLKTPMIGRIHSIRPGCGSCGRG